jgi:methyltransferase
MNGSLLLLGFLTLQRLAELAWAARNTSRLLAAGGIEFGRGHYPVIVALHAAWLIGLWLLAYHRPIDPLYFAVFVLLQLGRLSVLASLGRRWTTRVVVIPGAPLVTTGIYRLLRHPNYLIVAGEIVVVPLAFGLPVFAALFLVLNSLVLVLRIRIENAALAWASGQSSGLAAGSLKDAARGGE